MSISMLLRLRLMQVSRMIKEVGLFVLILLLFVSVAFTSQMILFLIQSSLWEGLVVGLLIISSVHLNRKDLFFLQIYTRHRTQLRLLLFAEYLLLIAPLILITLGGANWQGALGFGMSAFFSLLFPLKSFSLWTKSRNTAFSWIPLSLFEMRSVIRQRLWWWLLVYLTGYLCFLHIAFFIICIVLCCFLISSAFDWVEPPALIHWQKRFIFQKNWANTLFIHALLCPIYLLLVIFHWHEYYLLLFALLMIQLTLFFSISYKYAFYRPSVKKIPQTINHALFFLFLFLPGFQLVSLFLCGWYFVKAQKTMSYFWNDQNLLYAPGT